MNAMPNLGEGVPLQVEPHCLHASTENLSPVFLHASGTQCAWRHWPKHKNAWELEIAGIDSTPAKRSGGRAVFQARHTSLGGRYGTR